MSEATQGGDRHAWESEYEMLADDLRTEPEEALPELLDLVERMLAAAGYEVVPGTTRAPDVDVALERAREAVRRSESGEAVGNDDAFQAVAELREVYKALLDHPEAESGADLRRLGADPAERHP